MISRDFTEAPEHRTAFYKLLRVINLHCFPALLTIPPQQFKLFMDSIIWAIKHTMRDIAETGLNCEYSGARIVPSSLTTTRSVPRGHQQLRER